jgi:outer membrane lipoprotein-sorting protein
MQHTGHDTRVRLVALCLLALTTVAAGCITSDSDPELPDSEEINETYSSLDAYAATAVVETTSPNRTTELRTRLVVKPGTDTYYEREQNLSSGVTVTTVSNGTVQWTYNESGNTVRILNASEVQNNLGANRRQIRRLVNRVKNNDSGGTVSPVLPILSPTRGFGAGGGGEDRLNLSTTTTYEGVESVGTRDAHVISVTSGGGETASNLTYYLDTEWYVILGIDLNVSSGGQRRQTTFRLQNVTFNPDLSPDRFEFTPPENATVTRGYDRPEITQKQYDTRTQLVDDATISVPGPDLPEEFSLQTAELFRTSGPNVTEQVSLRYSSDVAQIRVERVNTSLEINATTAERVEIGDKTGILRQYPRQKIVRWTCNGSTQFVIGPLGREQLVAIADSVACS